MQLHLTFTFALALLCLNVTASLVLATQGLLLGVELEGFLIVLGKEVTEDLESAVQSWFALFCR